MTIRDQISEYFHIEDPKILITEWLPFGNNQIAALNDKLGASRGLKGTYLTTRVDEFPERSIFSSEPIHTKVTLRDYDRTRFTEFTAEVTYPEEEEIVQKEKLAVHVSEQGLTVFGVDIYQVQGHEHRASIDHLTRVITDLIQDSSIILNTLLTHYQLRLLDAMFQGSAERRDKFLILLGTDISPRFKDLKKFMDGEEYQNELEQVMEILHSVKGLKDGSIVFVGSQGVLFISQNLKNYETVLGFYALVRGLHLFLGNYFSRLWIAWDRAISVRQMMLTLSEKDPQIITKSKTSLAQIGAEVILLRTIGEYIAEATESTKSQLKEVFKTLNASQKECAETLRIRQYFEEVHNRIDDVEKIIQGLMNEVEGLRDLLGTLSEKQMKKLYEAIQDSARGTQEVLKASERSGVALDLIQLILAGTIALELLTIFTGEITLDPAVSMLVPIATENPSLYLVISVLFWVGISLSLYRVMQWLEARKEPLLSATFRYEVKCDVQALEEWLSKKAIITRTLNTDGITQKVKLTWKETGEPWQSYKPRLAIVYDKANGYLLSLTIELDKPDTDVNRINHWLIAVFIAEGILERKPQIAG
ncbi:MAG: hypothetical protein ACTSYO_09395 [Candidatus Ranarchaeia archaeon]